MACTSVGITGASPTNAASAASSGMRRSDSSNEIRCDIAGIRRSRSEPQLRYSLSVSSRTAPAPAPTLKSSRSIGIFPFGFSGSTLPNSLRSFLFESEENGDGVPIVDPEDQEDDPAVGTGNRANWVERLMELRRRWRDRQHKEEGEEEGSDYNCGVSYDSEAEDEERIEWDRDSFSSLLNRASWFETRLFSRLAFLSNMAYVIPEIKEEDLRKYYGLRLVTSSLDKKMEAATIKAKLEIDSTRPSPAQPGLGAHSSSHRPLLRPSVAYEIAASAASYVHTRAKGFLSLGRPRLESCGGDELPEPGGLEGGPHARVYNSEVAAYVAATTMTAVVAAEEEARHEAAKDLRSLHSSPCEWFVCDDPDECTRYLVIQGSDSLASWQANLFFEPTKFEGTEVLVHRGIYEAAKGIYEQFLPLIQAHIMQHGSAAKVRFSGHSLGGSLSLLVSLMFLSRGAIPRSTVLPVVTFGSPAVFCGGQQVLEELGLDEGHVCSVMMHRDIVPRAFSCNYPNQVAQVLKRLNGSFRSHPCLNKQKLLYSPLGQLFILQPDEKSSPPHHLLPPGAALYSVDRNGHGVANAVRAFLNSPHPLETLSDLTAYGCEGTILRDHDSSNYLKAINGLLRQHTKMVAKRSRNKRLQQWWPVLRTTTAGLPGHSWSIHHEPAVLDKQLDLVPKEVVSTGA
ncbi:putative fungal lipase-like domain, alpha/Beta hydrolase, phospholipase A1 PLIP1/2/3 [Dioscorea sansibarensis]